MTDQEIIDRMVDITKHANTLIALVQSVQSELHPANALLARLADACTHAEDIVRAANLTRPRY